MLRLIAIVACVVVAGSCKKYFDPPQIFEKEDPQVLTKDRKVLLISIDGLGGQELKKYKPKNIAGLLDHAKYTFDGFTSDDTGDAATWAAMMSSKSSAANGIHGNDFEIESGDDDDIDHDGTGASVGIIPVFQRMAETGRILRSLTVTSWEALDKNIFGLADKRIVHGDDAAVKDAAVEAIKTGADQLAFSVVNFRDLINIGTSSGFTIESPAFKAGVDRIDGYVSDLIKAVKERNNFAKEDWLIIITSNHGGKDKSYGGSTLAEMNNFSIYYNPNFAKTEFKGDAMEYVNFYGWFPNESLTTGGVTINSGPDIGVHAVSESGSDHIFNINTTGELTVEFKVNFYQKTTSHTSWSDFNFNHQNIISKDENGTTDPGNSDSKSTPGWTITPYGKDGYMVALCDGTKNVIMTAKGRKNQTWQHIAVSFKKEDTKTSVSFYIDGILSARELMDIDAAKVTNSTPLVLGFQKRFNYGYLDYYMADFRFWNLSLAESDIKRVACIAQLSSSDPLYKNMIANYRTSEVQGKFKNEVAAGPELNISGDYRFIAGTNYSLCNAGTIVGIKDILPQVFYWLNIKSDESWGLEGTVFLSEYETEFVGK